MLINLIIVYRLDYTLRNRNEHILLYSFSKYICYFLQAMHVLLFKDLSSMAIGIVFILFVMHDTELY